MVATLYAAWLVPHDWTGGRGHGVLQEYKLGQSVGVLHEHFPGTGVLILLSLVADDVNVDAVASATVTCCASAFTSAKTRNCCF